MEEPIIQDIRDWFDELFLWTENEITEKSNQLFITLWIEWFAEIVARNKKYGFNATQKILADLVKLSFVVYTNVDNLPLQRKVILPEKNWSYKFIVTSLPHALMRWTSDVDDFQQADTNVLFLVATWDQMHADIANKIGLQSKYVWEINILWWARIDIDHDTKSLNIREDSGSYGSCSNQMVEWILEEMKDQWYSIAINMKNQQEFFNEKEYDNSWDLIKKIEKDLQNKQKELSAKELLEKKLELLHSLLVPWNMPTELPEVLSEFTEAFEIFRQTTKDCSDAFDTIYIDALRIFRDILLGQ